MSTKRQKGLLFIVLFLMASWAHHGFYTQNQTPHSHGPIEISEDRAQHILYGDHRGGGHLHGVGKACKSEFPKEWDEKTVLAEVKKIAANDNLNWARQDNGYFVAEEMVGDVRVRVVLDREKDNVITAYPVNVVRNPCLMRKPANDNTRSIDFNQ